MRPTKTTLSAIALTVLLSGCLSNPERVNPQAKMQALVQAGAKVSYVINVPSSGNALSDQFALMGLRSGSGSNSSSQIARFLQNGNPVAVMSDNDEMAAATIEAALRDTSQPPSGAKVYFIGDEKYSAQLSSAASAKGVALQVVSYP